MRKYYKLLILFGLVSLFADITYEGARGVLPSYLGFLGASATIVGLALGASELLGYVIRYPMGWLADRSGGYWFYMGLGYFINLVSVPLLALANRLDLAVLLVFLERIGKGIRSPSRETLLTNLSTKIPIGRVFGIHEMLDQFGAITGPFLAAAILYLYGGYRLLFLLLAIPAITALVFLATTYFTYDIPLVLEKTESEKRADVRNSIIHVAIFSTAVALGVLALVPYSIILYASDKSGFFESWMVPVIYLIIMGVDGLVSPLLGEIYSRFGSRINLLLPLTAFTATILFSMQTSESILASAFLAGVSIGVTETTTKSTVGELSLHLGRGESFGLYYTLVGSANIASGTLYGYLYDTSLIQFSPTVSLLAAIASLIGILSIKTVME